MNVDGQIHRQRKPAQRSVGIRRDAESRRIAGKFIKHQHRPAALRRQLRETADIELQIGPFDVLYFADGFRGLNKIA